MLSCCGACAGSKIHPQEENGVGQQYTINGANTGKLRFSVNSQIRSRVFQTERISHHPTGLPHNLSSPEMYGLPLSTEVVTISVSGDSDFIKGWWCLSPKPIGCSVLYLHGISNTRAYAHRVGLYRLLLSLGYNILTIDYRGFGDSSKIETTEETVVLDSRTALHWLKARVDKGENIIVWGHSLGASIACRTVAEEERERKEKTIATLVMESPFNNLRDEIQDVVFKSRGKVPSTVGKILPVTRRLKNAGMEFRSDYWITLLWADTVILHAEDDSTIDIKLARRLFKGACESGRDNVEMITFDKHHDLGHNNIYTFDGLPEVIERYIQK